MEVGCSSGYEIDLLFFFFVFTVFRIFLFNFDYRFLLINQSINSAIETTKTQERKREEREKKNSLKKREFKHKSQAERYKEQHHGGPFNFKKRKPEEEERALALFLARCL
jgi:hypothetical protein